MTRLAAMSTTKKLEVGRAEGIGLRGVLKEDLMPHVDGRQVGEDVGALDPLHAVNLPDARDGKEEQHGREEAAQIEMEASQEIHFSAGLTGAYWPVTDALRTTTVPSPGGKASVSVCPFPGARPLN